MVSWNLNTMRFGGDCKILETPFIILGSLGLLIDHRDFNIFKHAKLGFPTSPVLDKTQGFSNVVLHQRVPRGGVILSVGGKFVLRETWLVDLLWHFFGLWKFEFKVYNILETKTYTQLESQSQLSKMFSYFWHFCTRPKDLYQAARKNKQHVNIYQHVKIDHQLTDIFKLWLSWS